MKVQLSGIVTEVYVSERGKTYVTVVDLSDGSTPKFAIDGVAELRPGDHIQIEAQMTARSARGGGVYLSFAGGTISKAGVPAKE